MSGRPILAKYKHFKKKCEQTSDNSPTDSSSSCLNWNSDQNDNQRTKSHNETCAENSQCCSWLVVPTIMHLSRTHRVALDSLFDRINLKPKIQIKYIDTKNQLADMLTKGSFSKNEWYHLLCLFNIMSFQTYSTSTSKVHSLSLSSQRAPCDRCHVESRTRHNLKWWVSGGKSQTYQSGDVRLVQRGCLATKIGISGQSNRKKSWPGQRKLG